MNSRKRSKLTTIEERAKLVSWKDKVEIIVQDMYGASGCVSSCDVNTMTPLERICF